MEFLLSILTIIGLSIVVVLGAALLLGMIDGLVSAIMELLYGDKD